MAISGEATQTSDEVSSKQFGTDVGSGMIEVTVEIVSWLKDAFDKKGPGRLILHEAIAPGTSIMDLIQLMADKYPKFAKEALDDRKQELSGSIAVILNGSFVSSLAELNTGLKEGDIVTFLPAFSGG